MSQPSTQEYSPGPWKWAILGTGRDPLWVLESATHDVILTIKQVEFGPTTNPEANRAAISATPELLASVHELLNWLVVTSAAEHPGWIDTAMARKATAAIAKAESR